jgi:outer membrane protein TolC
MSSIVADARTTMSLLVALLLLAAAAGTGISAEAPRPGSATDASVGRPLRVVVDDYVRDALSSNLALRGQALEIERQLALLDEARSRFLPQLTLEARYTRADGGREIALPVGALLNPAYETLNELLIAQGDPPRFGTVTDSSFRLLREREQDTRLSLRQPLYAPSIPAAFRAQEALLGSSEYARQALARRLERDVTVGYLDWLRARGNVEIVAASVELLRENHRVNESLYTNGRVTRDQVLRARAELLAAEQQQRDVENLENRARQYVNFLRNRELEEALEPASPAPAPPAVAASATELRQVALTGRPELRELDELNRAARAQVDAARAARRPELGLAVDGGIQGEDYDYGSGYNFGTASLQLRWSLFDGGMLRARVDAARVAARQAATRREELARSIELDVQQALDRLTTAVDSLATAEARAEAARAGFLIASRKRDQGVISQVEFIDARSALTSADLNLNVTRFELLAREAELAYATAAMPLPAEALPMAGVP